MKKDLVYFSLFDTMSDQCCPICELIDKRIQQMMNAFLYESVNDTKLRNEISNSRGFCNYHGMMLMNKGDPLAHALIYYDILNLSIQDITENKFSSGFKHSSCIFCKKAKKMEEDYLSALSKYLEDQDFLEKYRTDGLLCIEHLQSLSSYRCPVYPVVKEITLSKYRETLSLLEEIKKKNDYRFADLPWSKGAKDSWKRAVSIINDSCGLRK